MTLHRPNFIGIGVQKGASTWLYRVLQDHPQVMVSDPKELDFFSCWYDRGMIWYENHFNFYEKDVSMVGEFSPSYFYHPLVAERIWHYRSNMRIIVSLRDPIERAYSQHLHEIRLGHFSGSDLSFEAGMRNNPMYLEQSLYAKHLAKWFQQFPAEQIRIFFLEEIKNDPKQVVERLCQFLNIPANHQPAFLSKKANVSYLPKFPVIEDMIHQAGGVARHLRLGSVVDKVRDISWVRAIRAKNQTDARQHIPPMLEKTQADLRQYFADDQSQLKKLLQCDQLPWER